MCCVLRSFVRNNMTGPRIPPTLYAATDSVKYFQLHGTEKLLSFSPDSAFTLAPVIGKIRTYVAPSPCVGQLEKWAHFGANWELVAIEAYKSNEDEGFNGLMDFRYRTRCASS